MTKGIGFLLLPIYTGYLSVAEYGTLDYLLIIGTFLAVVLPLEVSQGLHRFLPEKIDDPSVITSYYSTGFWFTTSVYIVFSVFCSVFSKSLSDLILGTSETYLLIIIASWMYTCNSLVYLGTSLLRSKLNPFKSTLLSILSALTTALVASYALIILDLGVEGVLGAMLIGSLISLLLSICFTYRNLAITFDMRKLKVLLKFSLPLVPSSISVIAAMYVDRLVIKDILTLDDLGQYAFASRIAMVASFVMVGFQQALSPLIYRSYRRKETAFDIAKLFWFFIAVSIVATLGLFLSRFYLLDILGNDDYKEAAALITPLSISVLVSSCYLFFPGLSIAKKSNLIAIITVLGALMNLGLNYFLIQEIGLIGAAYSSVFSAAVTALTYAIISNRYYRVPIFKVRVF